MGKLIDLTGKTFGYYTVIGRSDKKGHCAYWNCRCICGNEKSVQSQALLSGLTRSCGCKTGELSSKTDQYIGKRFGRVTVVSYYDSFKGHGRYKCICDCGNERLYIGTELKRTQNPACFECKLSNTYKHGMTGTKIHNTWLNMLQRCENPNSTSFHLYGERGIKVCDEWHDFQIFYKWASENGYKETLSIDRIDVNGNYEPDNCRWATIEQQANNKRTTRYVEYNGKNQSLSIWCKELGLKYKLIYGRLRKGWSVKDAFEIPSQKTGTNQFSTKRVLV